MLCPANVFRCVMPRILIYGCPDTAHVEFCVDRAQQQVVDLLSSGFFLPDANTQRHGYTALVLKSDIISVRVGMAVALSTLGSSELGLRMAVAIALHNIPEGLAIGEGQVLINVQTVLPSSLNMMHESFSSSQRGALRTQANSDCSHLAPWFAKNANFDYSFRTRYDLFQLTLRPFSSWSSPDVPKSISS